MFCTIIIILLLCPLKVWLQLVRIQQEETVDFNGRKIHYVFMAEGYTNSWYEALTFCAHQNMDLVTIDSPEKNAFISAIMQHFYVKKFWIGIKSDLPERINELEAKGRTPRNFYWIANNKATKLDGSYTNWCPGQPGPALEEHDAGHDVCGAIRTNQTCWRGYDCIWKETVGHGLMCEERLPPKLKHMYPRAIETVEFKGVKYTLHNEVHLSWKEANGRCNQNSQNLVNIESKEELYFIQDQVRRTNLNYWIGLSAVVINSETQVIEWRWTTHSDRNYFNNWCSPDVIQMGFNDTCAFIRANGLCWQNWACDNDDGLPDGFICKNKIETTEHHFS